MPVLVVQAPRGELDTGDLPCLMDGDAPPARTLPSAAAGETPLACPSAPLKLYEEDLVALIHHETEARSAHPVPPGIVHPTTTGILVCPLANGPAVRAKRQVVIMGQHVVLEPLRVQAFFPLNPQTSADAFPSPYFKSVPLALVVQVIGAHPDARLFACFPDGGSLQALPPIPPSSRQAPQTFPTTIPSLDQEDLVSLIHNEAKSRRCPFLFITSFFAS